MQEAERWRFSLTVFFARLAALPSLGQAGQPAVLCLETLAGREGQGASPEEVLLAVFVVRQITDG